MKITFEDYCRLSAKETFRIFGWKWCKRFFKTKPHHKKYYEYCRMQLLFWQSITGQKFCRKYVWYKNE